MATEAQASPDAKKKGPVAKIWNMVGLIIGICLGLIVLFTLGGSLFGMGVDTFSSAMQTVSIATTNAGNAIGGFATSIRSVSSGISRILLALVSALILPLILFLIGRMIYKEIKKDRDGAGY